MRGLMSSPTVNRYSAPEVVERDLKAAHKRHWSYLRFAAQVEQLLRPVTSPSITSLSPFWPA